MKNATMATHVDDITVSSTEPTGFFKVEYWITNLHTSDVRALKGLNDLPVNNVPNAKFRIEAASGVRIKKPTKKNNIA